MPILLLTGLPGVGKTTVLRRVAAGLPGARLGGVLTEEIRTASGERSGFRIAGFDGRSASMARVIAHAGSPGMQRVGKYGVDVRVIDDLAPSWLALKPTIDVYLVDEIGKMECLSQEFVAAMRKVLDSGKPVAATIALHGEGFIGEVKRRTGAQTWQVTRDNRDALPDDVLRWLAQR